MSEFVIECAFCGKSFQEEKTYEVHECSATAMLQDTAPPIKMEAVDHEEEEDMVDIKPVLSSTGEVIEDAKTTKKNTTTTTKKSKKRKKTWSWVQKPPKKVQKKVESMPDMKQIEEMMEQATETKHKADIKTKTEIPISIKPEPVELCEVVSVKDEPADFEESCDAGGADPLAGTVEDILGLQDEDYLIENFVEYDEDISNNLEIDETSLEDQIDAPIVQRNHKTVAEVKKEGSNVGRRIIHTSNRGHSCTICSKKFFERAMLVDHLKHAHRTPRPYACTVCHKRFTHKNYVNLHMRVHTGEKPYQCTLCDRSYSHKTSFTIHMRIHNGDRPYECNVCGKKCYDKSGLTSHMRSHTKETPYQCECCGRRFTHSKSLLVHRRNHTGEKPYVCPHCGRAFRHWHKHKIHIRLHTGERPYKCQVCNKGFPRNDEVKRHMKSHTGIKSFKCSICGVYCATQASITGHINLHHVNLTTDKKYLPEKTIVETNESGILGKKALPLRSNHRFVDNESYGDFTKPHDKANIVSEDAGSEAASSSKLQTIVSTRPMTPQEKVNNKSMTYRQFLNDQEQQLLAKGLKVVNKNNNTYGLAPVSSTPSSSGSAKSDNVESSTKVNNSGVANAFVRVSNFRKPATIKPATRIILPNYVGNNKAPLVLGEAATKLLLQSVDGNSNKTNPVQGGSSSSLVNNNNNNHQPVFIQTVGGANVGMSAPVVVSHQQPTTQSFMLQTTAGIQNTSSIIVSSSSQQQQFTSSSQTTISSTSSKTEGSILQRALTTSSNTPKAIKPAPVMPDNGNIIVLNKGVAPSPMVVQTPQNVMPQQQLLLLPGINGGPARLILLQPNNPQQSLIKLEPIDAATAVTATTANSGDTTTEPLNGDSGNSSSAGGNSCTISSGNNSSHDGNTSPPPYSLSIPEPVVIKHEAIIPQQQPQPMVQLHNAGATLTQLPATGEDTDASVTSSYDTIVKTESGDFADQVTEDHQHDELATPIAMPNMIKLEPID